MTRYITVNQGILDTRINKPIHISFQSIEGAENRALMQRQVCTMLNLINILTWHRRILRWMVAFFMALALWGWLV